MPFILSEDHSHHPRQVNTDAVAFGKRAARSSQSPTIHLVPSKSLRAPYGQRTAPTATNPFTGYLNQANPTMEQVNDRAYYLPQVADPPRYDQFTKDGLRSGLAAEELARPQRHLSDINYYPADNSQVPYYSAENPDPAYYPDQAVRDYQQAAFNGYQQAGAIGANPRSFDEIRQAHGYDCECKRCRYYKFISTFPAPYRRELERRELRRLTLREEKRMKYAMEMQVMERKRTGRVYWDV